MLWTYRCVFYYGLWRGHLAWRRTMRALLLERAGSCLRPPFKGPTFQGPGLSHPVPRRRNPDRWTCARSAACPGMQGLPATTGNSMHLCVVGLFRRLAPTLGRLPVQLFGFLRRAVAVSIGIESAVRSLAATQTGPGVRPVTTPTQFLHWPTSGRFLVR